jgi:hypothetical protein
VRGADGAPAIGLNYCEAIGLIIALIIAKSVDVAQRTPDSGRR